MQSGLAPGPDCITIEFYSVYQKTLAPRITSLLAQFSATGSLPDSLSEAVVVLVHKSSKDPEECASYRPISLLNADAKLLAKILAVRLASVIHYLVHQDRVYGREGDGHQHPQTVS